MFRSSSSPLLVNVMMRMLAASICISAVVASVANDQYCKVLTAMDDSLCVDGLCLVNRIRQYPCTDDIIDQSSPIYYELAKIVRAEPSLIEFFPETYPEYLIASANRSFMFIIERNRPSFFDGENTIKALFKLRFLVPLKRLHFHIFEYQRDFSSLIGTEDMITFQNSDNPNERKIAHELLKYLSMNSVTDMSISERIEYFNSIKIYIETGLLDDPRLAKFNSDLLKYWTGDGDFGLKPELESAARENGAHPINFSDWIRIKVHRG